MSYGLADTFRRNLREHLKPRGKKKEIAEKLKTSGSAISALLCSKGQVELSTVERYAEALALDPLELLGGVAFEVNLSEAVRIVERQLRVKVDLKKKVIEVPLPHKIQSEKMHQFFMEWEQYSDEFNDFLKNKKRSQKA